MKRTAAIGATAALLLGLAAPSASANTVREIRRYSSEGFAAYVGLMTCPDGAVGTNGGLEADAPIVLFSVPSDARSASLSIQDRSGTAVMAYVWDRGRPVGGFCGHTSHRFRVRGGGRLWVALFDAVTTTGPSIVTTGTVTGFFSG